MEKRQETEKVRAAEQIEKAEQDAGNTATTIKNRDNGGKEESAANRAFFSGGPDVPVFFRTHASATPHIQGSTTPLFAAYSVSAELNPAGNISIKA